jgi:uncharacterized protein (TIGR00369 family)
MPTSALRPDPIFPPTKQPNSRRCFACGLENDHGLGMAFYEVGADRLESHYTVPEHFEGYPGVVHGGIVASMLDEMVSRAAMIGPDRRFMMTARLSIRYRQPVPTGVPLLLQAQLTRATGRVATATAVIKLPDGSVAAEAEGTLAPLPEDTVTPRLLESLGWKVYPDDLPDEPGPAR